MGVSVRGEPTGAGPESCCVWLCQPSGSSEETGDVMTEAEWLACNDPTPMLEFLRDKASERKLRLFFCACCRSKRYVVCPIGRAVCADCRGPC